MGPHPPDVRKGRVGESAQIGDSSVRFPDSCALRFDCCGSSLKTCIQVFKNGLDPSFPVVDGMKIGVM